MGLIPVGAFQTSVEDIALYQGQQAYHLLAEAETNKVFSLFFKARIIFKSYIDWQNLFSRGYEEIMRVRGQPPKEKKITHVLKEQIIEFNSTRKKVSAYTQDPISALFYIRAQELRLGNKFSFNIDASKTNTWVDAEVIKKRNVRTKRGEISVWVIKAELKSIKKHKSKAKMTFWLSDDPTHTPVLMSAFTAGGFISLRLEE